ncbi:MAG: cytoskeleton protein RodZ, partial [Gaiellaceae bacterium]|nr:cytoskeleton protein RodZ [Gaiellaceae bacterium]
MFEIGASLREARTRRGLSAEDVQTGIRIRARYLTALEEERWELLPGEAYTRGFLRGYAEFLGLDGDVYIEEYNERVATDVEERFVPESLAPRRGHSRLLSRTIVGVILVAAVLAALAAFGGNGSSGRQVSAAALVDVAAAATPKATALGMPVAPVASPAPAAKKTLPSTTIRAVKTRSWLSIRIGGPGGKEIFRGTLYRGHSLHYGLRRHVWMRIGRPHALAITV